MLHVVFCHTGESCWKFKKFILMASENVCCLCLRFCVDTNDGGIEKVNI